MPGEWGPWTPIRQLSKFMVSFYFVLISYPFLTPCFRSCCVAGFHKAIWVFFKAACFTLHRPGVVLRKIKQPCLDRCPANIYLVRGGAYQAWKLQTRCFPVITSSKMTRKRNTQFQSWLGMPSNNKANAMRFTVQFVYAAIKM